MKKAVKESLLAYIEESVDRISRFEVNNKEYSRFQFISPFLDQPGNIITIYFTHNNTLYIEVTASDVLFSWDKPPMINHFEWRI